MRTNNKTSKTNALHVLANNRKTKLRIMLGPAMIGFYNSNVHWSRITDNAAICTQYNYFLLTNYT